VWRIRREALVKQQSCLSYGIGCGHLRSRPVHRGCLPIRLVSNLIARERSHLRDWPQRADTLSQNCPHLSSTAKWEPAMWLLSPQWCGTNEQCCRRPFVRRCCVPSFGSQSQAGITFVAHCDGGDDVASAESSWRYMTAACLAAREGKPAPSLLPEAANSSDQILPAADP